ncbi:hypothetical protein NXH76_21725 [Blautia schinkii]|nr:hypothetical protein [Blautia schinkii]
MRLVEFSIEDNGVFLEIGKTYKINEFQSANYYYMLENAWGMSRPIPANQRLKSSCGILKEKKETLTSKLAILEFDE